MLKFNSFMFFVTMNARCSLVTNIYYLWTCTYTSKNLCMYYINKCELIESA